MPGCLAILLALFCIAMVIPFTIALLGVLYEENAFLFYIVLFSVLACIIAIAYFKSRKKIIVHRITESIGEKGKEIKPISFCSYCGERISYSDKKCPSCGAKVKK